MSLLLLTVRQPVEHSDLLQQKMKLARKNKKNLWTNSEMTLSNPGLAISWTAF
jgi:hypothetical protein